MNDRIKEWAERLAKALLQPKEKYLITREDLTELSQLLDDLSERETYGEI